MIPLFDLNYGEEEVRAVTEVLRSKWISMGPKALELENRFTELLGVKYAVALTNCTAALHLAMILLDIQPGDEVIVPSLTFVATVNAVRYVGATPVFAEVTSLDDWTISVEDIGKKITPKTRAVIPMHYAGFTADMEKIMELARRHGLSVVEDACHAPGGTRGGIKAGSTGDIACYSFYTNKNLATGEGGMLVTNSKDYADRARLLRTHGQTLTARDRIDKAVYYGDVIELGYNYRLDDIRACLGLVQLQKLPVDIRRRNEIAARYRKNLKSVSSVRVPFPAYDGISPYYIFPVYVRDFDRQKLMDEMISRGVQTSYHYPPVHHFKLYRDMRVKLPLTEDIAAHCISLPIYPTLSDENVDYVCATLSDILGNK